MARQLALWINPGLKARGVLLLSEFTAVQNVLLYMAGVLQSAKQLPFAQAATRPTS
jgi:hypothetical protein